MTNIKAYPIYKKRIHPLVTLMEISDEPGQISYLTKDKQQYIIPLLEVAAGATVTLKSLKMTEKYDILAYTGNYCIDGIIKTINKKIDQLIENHKWFDEIILAHYPTIEIYDFNNFRNRQIEYYFTTQVGIILFEY